MHVLRSGSKRFGRGVGGNQLRVPDPCPQRAHRGLVHGHCMMERADRIAQGHVDPRSCIACRSEWAGGSRLPHPVKLVRGLSMTEPGVDGRR